MAAYHSAEQFEDHRAMFLLGTKQFQERAVFDLAVEALPFVRRFGELSDIYRRHEIAVDRILKCENEINMIDPKHPNADSKLYAVFSDINRLLPVGEERQMRFYVDVLRWFRSEVVRRRNYRLLSQEIKEVKGTVRVSFESTWQEFKREEWKPVRGLRKKRLTKTDLGWQVDLEEQDVEFWKKYIVPK